MKYDAKLVRSMNNKMASCSKSSSVSVARIQGRGEIEAVRSQLADLAQVRSEDDKKEGEGGASAKKRRTAGGAAAGGDDAVGPLPEVSGRLHRLQCSTMSAT